MGLRSIVLTGKNTKKIEKFVIKLFLYQLTNTSRIQEMHIMLGQMLCNAIEFNLGLASLVKEER